LEQGDNATFQTWEDALYFSYDPVGIAKDVRNALGVHRYWLPGELRRFVLETGIVSSPESFDNALDELLRNGYARIIKVDGVSCLSSCLPLDLVADPSKTLIGKKNNDH
jgi:hypothetical protein